MVMRVRDTLWSHLYLSEDYTPTWVRTEHLQVRTGSAPPRD